MAQLLFRARSKSNYTPASYTANETVSIINVAAGDLVGYGFCRIRTAFNGTNSDASIIIGDGSDTDRFFETGDITETTAGVYRGLGVGLDNAHLYTANDTIDIVFTADTGADGTAGSADVWFYIAKVDPH